MLGTAEEKQEIIKVAEWMLDGMRPSGFMGIPTTHGLGPHLDYSLVAEAPPPVLCGPQIAWIDRQRLQFQERLRQERAAAGGGGGSPPGGGNGGAADSNDIGGRSQGRSRWRCGAADGGGGGGPSDDDGGIPYPQWQRDQLNVNVVQVHVHHTFGNIQVRPTSDGGGKGRWW